MPPAKRKTINATSASAPRKKPVARKRAVKKKKALSPEWKFAIAALLLVLFSPLYYGYIIKGFTSSWRWIKDIGEDPNYRTYSSFDIRIPKGYTIHGIDVSYYQGKIDWKKVKAMEDDDVRIKFAFIKATEGMFNIDPYFQRNWREAPKAGITCGAYHYFKPKKSGEWQARFFLQTVKFEVGDLPPVVDIEELNGVAASKMRIELQVFLTHIEKKTNVKPIIYTGLSFYNDYLKGHFDEYPLWVAHYHQPRLKVNMASWHFWQHSDKAKISGINHVVDFNVFNGDSLAFEQMLIK
ncbi:MAG TPA: glycoside hydrolase family 25 protein [Pedobacter sp.]|uniref:glycoside hydrolase family 25 protein n=1 Tax=Pedobacter sp. TaxID=1411316 RepID=UPI002B90F0F0|nr:glycoside hydrolase family 25 protein [Pedobacter sp.]HMI02203.1 glycoside hydrolase family 25 protein [Pedobacter sp.]